MEAPPTAELELMANWPTASLSNNGRELSVNSEVKSLQREKRSEQKQLEDRHESGSSDYFSPAGHAGLNPQLDAEKTHSLIITHLDAFIVHRAED